MKYIHTIINIRKKITLNYPKYNNVCSYGIFSLGLKNEFEKAVVNEPSVFELLKFYCISVYIGPSRRKRGRKEREMISERKWLVGCVEFNGPLRQYFSLYRAVSQREGDRVEKG